MDDRVQKWLTFTGLMCLLAGFVVVILMLAHIAQANGNRDRLLDQEYRLACLDHGGVYVQGTGPATKPLCLFSDRG